jgi:phosphate transport system permease protein
VPPAAASTFVGHVPPAEERIVVRVRRNRADKAYRAITTSAALAGLTLMGLIGLFLVVRAWPALRVAGWHFLTETAFNTNGAFGIAAVVAYTAQIAVIALALAIPFAIGASLFITEYAPRKLRRPLTSLVDLLAAIPSLIYGLWGREFLQPQLIDVSRWLNVHFSFVPIFRVDKNSGFAASTFIAGVVVARMIVPIITAVMREAFSQAPAGEREGALALGATKWGMIRAVVLPFGRGAMIGGSMLGLGRALGETIAVLLIISPTFNPSFHVLQTGSNSIAALIAARFGEANEFGISALMAAGLVLFAMTLLVNFLASVVVARSRSGAATEI